MKHKLTLVLLSFFLGVQCMVAQQMKVTGVVINEDDGEPVIGASIVVKGTTIGTDIQNLRTDMQIIFQDPYSSLNPRMTVRELICAPLDVFAMGSKEEKEARVIEIMDKVGLPLEFMNRYPQDRKSVV